MVIEAHTIVRDSNDFADGILFDGSTTGNPDTALYLQAARDDQDGAEIYAEIPVQRFAIDAGISSVTIRGNRIEIALVEPLNGESGYQLTFPQDELVEVINALKQIFRRQPESLKIGNEN